MWEDEYYFYLVLFDTLMQCHKNQRAHDPG